MIRFGLLAVVSTAAIAMYGDATSTECPTIGVDLGIIEGHTVESCLSQRQSKHPWTLQRNSDVSEIQFRKTNESSLLRYVWDMSNDAAPVPTNFKKFVVAAPRYEVPSYDFWIFRSVWALPRSEPTTICDPGFKLRFEAVGRALCDNDVSLIIVVNNLPDDEYNDRQKESWTWWADSFNKYNPNCRSIQVTSVSPGLRETFEDRVMEAVKPVIYKQLASSTSSVRDKFPRCSFIPLCPSTQILNVVVYPRPVNRPSFIKHTGDSGTGQDTRLETECYVDQREQIGRWNDQELGWQSRTIKDYSLYRVVLAYSKKLEGAVELDGEGIVRFSENAERAMVITISDGDVLRSAPEHDINQTYLESLTGTIEPSFMCISDFWYTWDHFYYGLWREPRLVVVLVPFDDVQIDILVAVRDRIEDEQMKKRMIIMTSRWGDCFDELQEYYKLTLPLTFGSCRAELFP